jgi:hypothetical protein
VADYVDHTARLWAEGLARIGYVVHCCRPADIRPALLQAYRTDILILAVSRVRGAIEYEDLEGHRVRYPAPLSASLGESRESANSEDVE